MAINYNAQVAMIESGGNPYARNSRSSATGTYQFTRPTWRNLMMNYPELGLTPDGMTDPDQQERAMDALTSENRQALQKVLGRDPSEWELYGAHHFGSGDFSRIAKADPSASLYDVLSPRTRDDVIAANPQFRGKTVGDVQSWLQQKMNAAQDGSDPNWVPNRDIAPRPTPQPLQDTAQTITVPVLAQAMNTQTATDAAPEMSFEDRAQKWMADNSDALLRFGAGMLAGSNLREGMALAAKGLADSNTQQQAIQKQKQDYMEKLLELGVSPADAQAIAEGSKKVSDLDPSKAGLGVGGFGKQQQGELYYGPDNTPYREIFNPRGGSVGFLNLTSGKVEKTLPQSSVRATDAGLRYLQKSGADAENGAMDAAIAAKDKLAHYSTLETALEGVKTGGDIMSTFGRWVAQKTGVPFNGNDPASMDLAKQEFNRLELEAAGMMKGQGQITEGERAILRGAVPNMATNPEALKAVLGVMKAQEQRKMDLMDAWTSASPEDRAKGFKMFQYQFLKNHTAPSVAPANAPSTGGAAPTGGDWNTTAGGTKFRVIK